MSEKPTDWSQFTPADQPAPVDWSKFTPVKKAGGLRALADTGLGFAGGAVAATKGIAQAFGANNQVAGVLGDVGTSLNNSLSDEAKFEQQAQSQIMGEAKDKGAFEGIKAGARAFGRDPVQMVASGAGSIVPFAASMLAGPLAVPAAGVIGAGMGAGVVKGSIYEDIKAREKAAGKSDAEAEQSAMAAQAYDGQNKDQIALGAGLGVADAAFGAVPAALRILKGGARQVGAGAAEGVFRSGLKGILTEAPVEFAQGGQEQLAANVAAQRAGFEAGTWDGVASQGALEALAAAPVGGAFGIMGRNRGAPPPGQTPPGTPPGTAPGTPGTPAGQPPATPGAVPPTPLGASLTGTPVADLLGGQVDPLQAVLQSRQQPPTGAPLTNTPIAGLLGERRDPIQDVLAARQEPPIGLPVGSRIGSPLTDTPMADLLGGQPNPLAGLAPLTRTPAQELGIDPAAGTLSAAATVAVNGPARGLSVLGTQPNQSPAALNPTQGTTSAPQADQAQQTTPQRPEAQPPVATGPLGAAANAAPGAAQPLGAANAGVGGELPGTSGEPIGALNAPAPLTRARTIEPGPAVVLQNRDRSSAASVAQMNEIAANPDYLRAGQASVMDSGAPVVFGDAPETALVGREAPVADGRGQRTQTQYMVVEAADLLASNLADGTRVPEYEQGQPGKLRAVAGNGRAAGITEAYSRGTAGQYKADLVADAQSLGMEPAAIEAMSSPVLVRVMSGNDVTADMGDRSNIAGTARLSATEQANTDARRVDLSALEFDDQGNPTANSVRQFTAGMPTSERSEMLNADGTATRQAIDRLMAATFKQAYASDELVQLYAQATDPDARTVMTALADAAGAMAGLSNAGDLDIRSAVAEAAGIAVNARRRGISLADMLQNADIETSGEAFVIARFFADNIRSAKKMAEGLRNWANYATEQAQIARSNETQDGLFGATPVASRGDVFQRIEDGQVPKTDARQPARQDPATDGAKRAPNEPDAGQAGAATGDAEAGQAEGLIETAAPAPAPAATGLEQIRTPQVIGKIGPTTFDAPPVFESLAEVSDWAEQRAKDLGMGSRQFTATHEYFHAYKQIEVLVSKSKAEQDKAMQATGKALQAKMAAAGVKVGDKVQSNFAGPFLSSFVVTGSVYLNNNGVPTVKLDAAVPVTRAGGRPGTMTKTSWNAGFKPMTGQAAPAAAPAAVEDLDAMFDDLMDEVAPAAETEPQTERPSTYLNGDRAEYTGKTENISGGTFYEVEFTEGAKQGQTAVTARAPDGQMPAKPAEQKPKGPTPQIPSAKQIKSMIAVSADSIEKLRKPDVDRVISEAPAIFRQALSSYIKDNRPDLAAEVDEVMAEMDGDPILTAPTEQEILDRQEAAEAADRQAKAAERAAAVVEKKRQDRADIAMRSESAAGAFELGQDPLASLTGQESIFGDDAPAPTRAPRSAGQAVKSAASNSASAVNNAIDGLGALFGGGSSGRLGSGLSFDEDTYAKAKPLFIQAVANLKDAASDIREAMKTVIKMVMDKFGPAATNNMKPYIVRFASDVRDGTITQEEINAASTDGRVERDSQEPTTEPTVGDTVPPGIRPTGDADGAAGGRASASDGSGQPDLARVQVDGTVARGERGDQRVPAGNGQTGIEEFPAGVDLSERGGDPGIAGIPAEPISAEEVDGTAVKIVDDLKLRAEQRKADAIPVKSGDIANIRATLPYLLEGQQDDVKMAEDRFAKADGYGMLFTNGTGTGKTFSGLGIVKRFDRQGKSNILIAAPNDKIASDWIASAKALGLTVTKLENTTDAGKGIVVTTYANMGDNDALATRAWDLVVADEAHSLMMSKDGDVTKHLANLRAITMHPDGAFQRAMMLHGDIRAEASMAQQAADLAAKSDDQRDWPKVQGHQDRANKLNAEFDGKLKAVQQEVAGNQGAKRPRAVFLSATPFAYEKDVDWANGYLFDYSEGQPADSQRAPRYNEGDKREKFMMQNFGYFMRYNKLNEPNGRLVDRGLMQRQFNGMLKQRGSLAGRMLDVKADYDRRFVLVDSAIGNQIDGAIEWLEQNRKAHYEEHKDKKGADMPPNGYAMIQDSLNDTLYGPTGHLLRRYLLEAIKAKEVVPIIKQHMAMGRKVVVFHDFKKGGAVNPFRFMPLPEPDAKEAADSPEKAATLAKVRAYNQAVAEFDAKFPRLSSGLDLADLASPIERFKRELPGTIIINGDETNKKKLAALYDQFNSEEGGPSVALVQSAKNAGWSGHDTTGKHPRVLFNLGLPTQPTMSIQQEGRIYRTGQASNAMFRYLNTGTNWERWAFAQTIADRASAAENLGMGEMARALKDGFIAAFEESDTYAPGHEGEGTGGKERDKAANNALTAYERAKSFYWGTQKKNSKTKAQEGTDYFATPEPIGLKMVQWLGLRGTEDALEPSGGHGAIARWLPETSKRTVIEPSTALRSRLAMVMNPAEDRILDGQFEDLAAVNKFDGIAMNPPFGVGGKTAIEHLAKAATHLRDGGRIVALIPTGPAADKRFEKWMYEKETRPIKPLTTHPTLGAIYAGDTLTTNASWAPTGVVVSASAEAVTLKAEGMRSNTGVAMPAVTAVKPTGKRTEEYSPAANLYLVADIQMPAVTFERAGTKVMTRIVVIEKQADAARAPNQRNTDLSGIEDIGKLFDRMENLSLPERPMTKAQEQGIKAEEAEQAAQAEREKKKADRKAPKAEQSKPAAAEPGSPVKMGDNTYKVEVYTTNGGKELRGVWVKTRAEALRYGSSTFEKRGKGFFVRERDFPASTEAAPQGNTAAFSRSTGTNTPSISKSIAAQIVDNIKARWANAPEIVVAADMQDMAVPKAVRDEDAKQRSQGAAGVPEGFFYGGKVYVVASALNSPGDVVRVLMHESLGHYGLRGVFGDSLAPILNQIATMRRGDVLARARQYGLVMADASGEPVVDVKTATDAEVWAAMNADLKNQAAEEVLAFLAQTRPDLGFVKRAIASIRAFLRKNIPGFGKMTLTDEDIVARFILPARAFVERGGRGAAGALPAMSRNAASQTQAQSVNRSVGDAPPAEAQRVQAAIEGKGLIESARFLTQSSNQARAVVAQKVVDKLVRLERAGVDLKLNIAHRGDMAPAAMASSRGYTETGFDEKGRDIEVWLNGADVVGKVGTEEEVLLHELVHAATTGMVFYGQSNPNSLAGKHARDLVAVTDAISAHITQRFADADAGKVTLTEFELDMREKANNAFQSEDEVLAWALSNAEAQQYLEGIPYKSGSMWSGFVQAVRTLLGLSPANDTALSEVLRVADRLMTEDAPQSGRAAFWHKRGMRMVQQQGRGSLVQRQDRAEGADPTNPDIRFSRTANGGVTGAVGRGIDRARDAANAMAGRNDARAADMADLTDEQRALLGKIGSSPTPAADAIRSATDRAGLKIRQGMLDRYAALKDLDERTLGANFLDTAITDSSWVLAKMASAASGALNGMMNVGRIQYNTSQKVIEMKGAPDGGLTGVLKKLGPPAEVERFFGWVAANRASRLLGEGRENLFTPEEIAAGMAMNKGSTEAGAARGALYAAAFNDFQRYRDDVLAIAEAAGIISDENRAMWRDEFYVPFYRVMDEDAKAGGPGGGGGLSRQEAFKRLKGGQQNLNDLMENTLMNFHHLLSASLKNQAAAQAMKNAELAGLARVVPESRRDTKTSTFVLSNGKKVFYQVDDPLVFEAITTLSDPGLNSTAVKVMSAFKRVFTQLTTVTPQFIIANTFRDLLQATATSPTSKNIAKNLAQGIKSYQDEKIRAEMLASGGAFSFGHIYGMDADEIRASLRKTVAGAELISDPSMIPGVLRKGWAAWDKVVDASENISRAATYVQNVDQLGKLRAAFEARDVMDFSQHGAWPAVRFMIRVVPFLNARLQGLDKLYRSGLKPSILTAMGKGSDTDKQAAARFATVTGALTVATLALYMANADDEEYQKLEEWQKDTYWFFRIGGNAYFLPKPFEVGAIATLAERTLQQAMDDKATGRLFGERMKEMLMQTFAFNPVPQMFQPVMDIYSNRDAFTGRDIETTGMERMSLGLRARDTTTAPARAISEASRVLGDKAPFAISPVQADHLIKGYLGGLGASAAGILDTMHRAAIGLETPDRRFVEYQPIRRFYRDLETPVANTRYSTLFYDGLREVNRVYADVRELQKLGRTDEAQELAAKRQNALQMRIALNANQRKLSDINNRLKEVRRSDNDGEWKRREVDLLNTRRELITERMGKMIENERATR